jgi:tight adherence protein B
MNAQLLLPSIAVALCILCAAVGIYFAGNARRRNSVRDRLEASVIEQDEDGGVFSTIVRDLDDQTGWLRSMASRFKPLKNLELLMVQAGSTTKFETYVTFLAAGSVLAGALTFIAFRQWYIGLVAASAVLIISNMVLVRKKNARINNFERHFPDSLDMLTSALRAGLALSAAIRVVAEEAPQAVAQEFMILFEEHRLGLDLRDALFNLSRRVDSTELRLFVTAILLQRETGGNLTEILDRTAYIIRDRFRILGDVKTMTAQARLSGLILSGLPLVLAGVIFTIAPDYLKTLINDPAGPYLVGTALTLQVVGYAIMNRIVSIKV